MTDTMSGHFHVGLNMPGYLPESEVHCVDNAADAWMIWHDEITRGLDSVVDDGDFLDIEAERHTITESDVFAADQSVEIEGYVYWVERSGEDIRECPATDVELVGFSRAELYGAGA